MILTEEECDLSPIVQTNDSHNALWTQRLRDRIIVTEQVPRVVCMMTRIVKRASDDGVVIPPWVVCIMNRIVKRPLKTETIVTTRTFSPTLLTLGRRQHGVFSFQYIEYNI